MIKAMPLTPMMIKVLPFFLAALSATSSATTDARNRRINIVNTKTRNGRIIGRNYLASPATTAKNTSRHHHHVYLDGKLDPALFERGGGRGGKQKKQSNNSIGSTLFRQDGKKSAFTGLPMLQPWVYPPIELGFVISFWVFALKFFTNEARTFWIYMSAAHMALITITDYCLDDGNNKKEKQLRLWNIPIVPIKYMWYYDILLTLCCVVHPILYPDGYGSLFWVMVGAVPILAPSALFSIDTNPNSN